MPSQLAAVPTVLYTQADNLIHIICIAPIGICVYNHSSKPTRKKRNIFLIVS